MKWKAKDTKIIETPFRHVVIEGLFENLDNIVSVLKDINYNELSSDLYEMKQSEDFNNIDIKEIKDLHNAFSSNEFVEYIGNIFGIKLNNKIDMHSLKLRPCDYLLPHDDRLESRKIAYILYLCDFKNGNGGELMLFSNNKVSKKIIPKFGQLVMFEVSDKSWHQINEVLKGNRLSIGGWFHGS